MKINEFNMTRVKIIKALIFVNIVVQLSSCGYIKMITTKVEYHDWFEVPNDLDQSGFEIIPISYVEVKPSYLEESINRLFYKKYIILSNDEVSMLTGKKTSEKAILIRALYFNYSTGGYTLYKNNNNSIFLTHDSLSKSSKMKKHAIVLYVDEYPSRVYVGCSAVM